MFSNLNEDSSLIRLDKKDKRILAELDFNARATLAQVARRTRCSKQVVKYRIDELMAKGVIARTYAAIDRFKLGHVCCQISIKLKNVTKKREQEILAYINNLSNVKSLFSLGGQWDMIFVLWTKDTRELAKLIDRLNSRYGRFIQHKYLSISTRFTYFSYKYIHGFQENRSCTFSIYAKPYGLGIKELKLLKLLESDARLSNTELAKALKQSPETVRRKIKELQKKGIIATFRIEIDSLRMGFHHYKLFINLKTRVNKRVEEFISYLQTLEPVLYICKSIEKSDMEVNLFVKTHSEFHDVLGQIRYRFPDIMEDYNWNVAFIVKKP